MNSSYQIDFTQVAKISFSEVLKYLGIPFKVDGNKITGDGFTVNIEKNLYWVSENDRGSVINFMAKHRGCSLFDAAKELYDHFQSGAAPQHPVGSDEESMNTLPEIPSESEPEKRANEDRQVHPDAVCSGPEIWWNFDINGNKIGYSMRSIRQ